MRGFIAYLKQLEVHTPRLALVRFLLAFGMLLTIVFNDIHVLADQRYDQLSGYRIKQRQGIGGPFSRANLYLMMPDRSATIVVVVILLVVMSGFAPQISCLLHYWACFSFHNYYTVLNGGDDLTFDLALLLIPICLTDRRLNQWKEGKSKQTAGNIVAAVSMTAIWLLVAWLYFDAYYFKLFKPQWSNGTALYYYLSHYRVGAPDWLRSIDELLTTTQFVKLLTWGTLLLEFLLSIALLLPARFKRKLFIAAIIFHFLIAIHLGLITFFIAIVAALLLYLDDGDNITRKILLRKKVR